MQDKRYLPRNKRWLAFFILAALLLLLWSWFRISISIDPPSVADHSADTLKVTHRPGNVSFCGQSWLKKDTSGLWLMFLKGSPYERGIANGKLTKALIFEQEKAFLSLIHI